MKTEKKTKTDSKKEPKPMITIELPEETVKVSAHVRISTAETFRGYCEFLTKTTGRKITADQVMESLIRKLESDKCFKASKKAEANA